MKNRKLIKLLKSLDPEEFKQLYKFIRSPFFTSSKDLLKLFDYLRKHYPDFPDHLVEKKRIFSLLFPSRTYSDPRLRNLMGKLSQIIEDYLLYLETAQDNFTRRMRLKEIYGKRNLYDLFKRESGHLITEVEEQAYRGSDHYKNLYSLNSDLYFHPQTNRQGNTVIHINAALDNLIHYFAITQSRLICELKSRGVILSEENNIKEIDFTGLNLEGNLLLHLLVQVKSMLEADDLKIYKKLKKDFILNVTNFNHEDNRYLLLFLLNYTIRQSSKNETFFFEEAFDLYKFGIDQSLLINNGQLTDHTFLNIVITGSKLKAFSWTKAFIDKYQDSLNTKTKEDVLDLAMAYWYFHKGEYKKIADHIREQKSYNTLAKINTRSLSLRACFELYLKDDTYFDNVIDGCKSFEKYIRRSNVISAVKKETSLNFVKLLRKVTNMDKAILKTQEGKKNMLIQLESYKNIIARGWLKEKIQSF